jgi:hypothetical protein
MGSFFGSKSGMRARTPSRNDLIPAVTDVGIASAWNLL